MASKTSTDNPLTTVYERRIGDTSTGDEARGYWTFVLGLLFGFAGIGWLMMSDLTGTVPQGPVVMVGIALVLLIAGPIIRLPLQQRATAFVYAGVAISLVGVVWFMSVYPGWRPQAQNVIGLYSIGLLVIAVGGVLVPILTDREELETEVTSLHAEQDELRQTVRSAEANEADLAGRMAALQNTLSETERKNNELAHEIAQLKEDNADTRADEADLAERIAALQTILSQTERKNSNLADEISQLNADNMDAVADQADLAAIISGHQDSQAQFELYEDHDAKWRWRLRHRNGNVIADSNQAYARKHGAQQGMQAVRRDALGATLLLIESEADLPEAEAGHGFIFPDEVESDATFELYEDKGGEYRWRLRHDNGQIIADGREGYTSRSGAETAIEGIRKYVGPAEYLQPDPTAIEIYKDEAGDHRWRLRHENGNNLASSGEGYANRTSARRAIDRIREGIDEMDIELYEDEVGGFRWRLAGGDDKIKLDSGRYESREGAKVAVELVRTYMPSADLLDIGQAAFEVYEDEGGEHRWRLRHRNGNILAGDGQGYADKGGMWDGIESMKRHAPNAQFEAVDG